VIGCVNGAEAAVSTGDWDWAREVVAEVLARELSDVDRAVLEVCMARLSVLRGDHEAARSGLARARAVIEALKDPQARASLLETESLTALADGRLDDARRAATTSTRADPSSEYGIRAYLLAARSGLWMSDRELAGESLEPLVGRELHGTWLEHNQRALEAGVAALDGGADEAAAVYSESVAGLRALGCPFDQALAQLDFVIVAGPAHPEAPAAAAEARAVFDRLGARPFTDRLDEAVAGSLRRSPASTAAWADVPPE
jgi:ATP/maltotriose-dependent transcriptional regulator MalT